MKLKRTLLLILALKATDNCLPLSTIIFVRSRDAPSCRTRARTAKQRGELLAHTLGLHVLMINDCQGIRLTLVGPIVLMFALLQWLSLNTLLHESFALFMAYSGCIQSLDFRMVNFCGNLPTFASDRILRPKYADSQHENSDS
jgi:hypothetical protein